MLGTFASPPLPASLHLSPRPVSSTSPTCFLPLVCTPGAASFAPPLSFLSSWLTPLRFGSLSWKPDPWAFTRPHLFLFSIPPPSFCFPRVHFFYPFRPTQTHVPWLGSASVHFLIDLFFSLLFHVSSHQLTVSWLDFPIDDSLDS